MQAERLVFFLHVESNSRHDAGSVDDPGSYAVCGFQSFCHDFCSVTDVSCRENGAQVGLGPECPAIPVPEGSLDTCTNGQAVYVHGVFFRAEHTAGIGFCPEAGCN